MRIFTTWNLSRGLNMLFANQEPYVWQQRRVQPSPHGREQNPGRFRMEDEYPA